MPSDMTMPPVGLPGRCMLAKARRSRAGARPRTARGGGDRRSPPGAANSAKVAAAATHEAGGELLVDGAADGERREPAMIASAVSAV